MGDFSIADYLSTYFFIRFMQKNIYITTPIYYVNDKPHIGHAYTTILADVLMRCHRILGRDTFFLTGTDEHGQKVQQAAQKRNIKPQEQAEECHKRFKELWQKLNIRYDYFLRTTEHSHCIFVQKKMQELYENGDIYSKNYEGWYSVGEERFFSTEELIDGKDPINQRPVEWLKEKNYFFRMSKYQKALIEHIQSHPRFILPEYRRNEVLGFLQRPLLDLCISRPKSRLSWGIPLPFDGDFVTYVWFDALLNYQSAVQDQTFPDKKPLWPADCHLIGKDILTTHAVYWPTILFALKEEQPRHILAHGWWLSDGKKLSKSSGKSISPLDYIDKYGVDAVRYFLMRNMTLGQDAVFSEELFVQCFNTDLANDLGNAVNRIHKFLHKHFAGKIPKPGEPQEDENTLIRLAQDTAAKFPELLSQINFAQILEESAGLVRQVNRYLEKKSPWHLVKDPLEKKDGSLLSTALYHGAEALRLAFVILAPVIPQKAKDGLAMLGITTEIDAAAFSWGILQGCEKIEPKDALFPRISK